MLAWAQACIDVSFIDIDGTDVNSSLNAAFIVREENETDALPPHGTMTEDSDSSNYKYYYIDYTAERVGNEYRIKSPLPEDDPSLYLLEGMPKVTTNSIGL
jgi:hypothetical protein